MCIVYNVQVYLLEFWNRIFTMNYYIHSRESGLKFCVAIQGNLFEAIDWVGTVEHLPTNRQPSEIWSAWSADFRNIKDSCWFYASRLVIFDMFTSLLQSFPQENSKRSQIEILKWFRTTSTSQWDFVILCCDMGCMISRL